VIPVVGAQGYAQVKFLKEFSEDAKVTHNNNSCFSLVLDPSDIRNICCFFNFTSDICQALGDCNIFPFLFLSSFCLQTVALVGESGSGKSTIIALL
jgi:ABC-type transport system involved in cytochrome bd biosynthesis fused ATPase/permease subunit